LQRVAHANLPAASPGGADAVALRGGLCLNCPAAALPMATKRRRP